jgi:hypothetical protein
MSGGLVRGTGTGTQRPDRGGGFHRPQDFDDALFAPEAAVVAAATNDGGDTLITFDAGNTVRLVGFNVLSFDTGDVLLH